MLKKWIEIIFIADLSSINGLNLCSYCVNDPVIRFDPIGHFWDYDSNGNPVIVK